VVDGLRGALGIEGDPATVEAKVKEAVTTRDNAIRTLLLETAVEREALKAGAKPDRLAYAARLVDLSGVEVDLDKRMLKNPKALAAKVGALKASIPELFGETPQPAPTPSRLPSRRTLASPPPAGADRCSSSGRRRRNPKPDRGSPGCGPHIAKEIGQYATSLGKRL
jgi:hypothetical protein